MNSANTESQESVAEIREFLNTLLLYDQESFTFDRSRVLRLRNLVDQYLTAERKVSHLARLLDQAEAVLDRHGIEE